MSKGKYYLAMIADIELEIDSRKESSESYEINELHEINRRPTVTPASILASSRFGSLTLSALRDALWLRTGLSRADAELVVNVYLESRIIVEGEDGLVRVRQ